MENDFICGSSSYCYSISVFLSRVAGIKETDAVKENCSALRNEYDELIKDKKIRCECGLK